MSWAKLDDRFWSNPKVMTAWNQARASIGLHCMAITYCAGHHTDGVVPDGVLLMLMPNERERAKAVLALLDAGLWTGGPPPEPYRIHDFLDFNESRAHMERRRESDRKRKQDAGRVGAESRWNPRGTVADSESVHMAPDPTRPDQLPRGAVSGAPSETERERQPLPTNFLKRIA